RVLPAHGEGRHLIAHAAFAKDCGIPESMVAFNGHVVRLAGGDFKKVGDVKVGRVGLDGKTPVALNGDALRERRRMKIEGMAHITVVLDDRGRLAADSMVTLSGLDAADDDDVLDVIEESIDDAITAMKPGDRKKDDPVHEAARTALRRVLRRETGKRPQVSVHVVRL
ncbi:MAG: MBL fold metallo-hydrolase, partial [Alphaproteobacteria bacterium]|nr:MBL fold metallo-hydrolase [Alphaproteobacteria bacterium]